MMNQIDNPNDNQNLVRIIKLQEMNKKYGGVCELSKQNKHINKLVPRQISRTISRAGFGRTNYQLSRDSKRR